ncbi:hypothetical protein PMI04_000680 [Sphingobium sp. AP49]|uniref:hypothetical protein n=1 Tax=Sphingobium sp. AP49 TaxID=1144307 RepID=UPI0024B39199|nr:hypothetical protein [Sphingobium sp. AP49]WHO39151.1 hypothetical protein PMI04_000680 [Sphingobium sp. AP49]
MSVDTIIRHAHIHAVCDDVASAATLDAQLAQAAVRLPAQVEALLPGALTLSHGDLAIAIGTLQVNLQIAADAKADAIAAAWAQAIVSAILAELPAVRARPQAAAASSEDAVYDDIWDAECAILRARATQAAMPWWAEEIDPAGIIERWLQREPARATILLLRLLMTEPALLHLLPEAHALRLAMLLRRQLNSRLAELGTMPPTTTLNPPSDPIGSLPIFVDKIASVLDGDLADRLRLLPEGLRALLTLAVVMATQPGRAMALASTPSDMPIQAPDIISAQPVRAVQSLAAANSVNAPGPVTSSDPAPLTEIFGGG